MNTAARSLSLRQRTLAQGVGVVMGVVLLYLYVGRPLWKRERGLRAERRDLDARIEQAEQLLRLEGALRAEWEKHRTDVTKLIQHHSPPAANPLLQQPARAPHPAAGQAAPWPVGSAAYQTVAAWIAAGCGR